MKKTAKNNLFVTPMIILLFSLGCQKKTEVIVPVKSFNEVAKEIGIKNEIDILLNYLSTLTGVDKKEFKYNTDDQQFYYKGIAQIKTVAKLTTSGFEYFF